jgi:AcrR family transcriptional regulator
MRDVNRPRDAYHHGDLRNALVASAVRLVERDGPGAFSLREAARDVGVSANAAYRHFEDKSALMMAAAAEGFARLAKRMMRAMDRAREGASAQRNSIARFKAVGRAYVEFAVENPELFRLMFSESAKGCLRASAPKQDRAAPTPWEILGMSLDALVHDGVLPAAGREGAELKAWTVVHGFALLTLDGYAGDARGLARAAALESVLAFAVVGLCGEAPSRR